MVGGDLSTQDREIDCIKCGTHKNIDLQAEKASGFQDVDVQETSMPRNNGVFLSGTWTCT